LEKKKFRIGDIVAIGSGEAIFIVADISEWYLKNDVEYEYELIQIYPITKDTVYKSSYHNNMLLKAKRFSLQNTNTLAYIQKEREFKGMIGKPDYMTICEENMKYEKEKIVDKAFNQKPVKTILYSHIETVDKCLDAMNDLKEMHDLWKDERYLEDRQIVLKRLEELVQ